MRKQQAGQWVAGSIVTFFCAAAPALAQITPDGTLGAERSIVTPGATLNGVFVIDEIGDRIDGGARRGINLFHSFQQFNISDRQIVFFSSPPGVRNIITRVTGGVPSKMFGTVGVDGSSANLFLLNPSGFVFRGGSNSDLRGSLIISTAESMVFSDGSRFSANPSQSTPVLTISVPVGLQFGRDAGSIRLEERADLFVPLGTLALMGKDIILNRGALISGIRVEVGSVDDDSLISFDQNTNVFTFDYKDVSSFRDIVLINSIIQSIDPTRSSGDTIIQGRNIRLTGRSEIAATTLDQGGDAGDIRLSASEKIELDGRLTGLFSQVYENSRGDGGDIFVNAKFLTMKDGAIISANTSGRGNAGNISINVANSVELSGINISPNFGAITSQISSATDSSGNGGTVSIRTSSLLLSYGGQVSVGTSSSGNGGSISIHTDLIRLFGVSQELSNFYFFPSQVVVNTTSSGIGGSLNITTKDLIVEDGARILGRATGSGSAGSLTVDTDTTQIVGISANGRTQSGLFFNTSGQGKAGNLTVFTRTLIVKDGGRVSAETSGAGQAGSLSVSARGVVEVSGTSLDGRNPSQLFFNSSGSGNAGELSISSEKLIIRNGGQISAATSSSGKGGIIDVNASNSVEISGASQSGQFSSGLFFDSQGAGNARGISITTGRLTVQNGGQATVSGSSEGTAGDLAINARSIFLSNQAQLTAITASSQGGNIRITGADTLSLFDRSLISASTDRGQGGTVSVAARDRVDLNNSRISAEATGNGSAGSVQITTRLLNVENGSQLSVNSSGLGNAGNLEIQARSVFMNDRTLLNARTRSGEGGNIQVNVADTLQLRRNSDIRTQADGTGNGGNISLTAGNFILGVLSEDSDVIASAVTGNGGNIFAKAEGIFGFRLYDKVETLESDFIASSQFGLDGIVDVQANNPRALPPLPNLTPPTRIDQGCQATGKTSTNTGRFADTGRGGMPLNPNQVLNRDALWSDRASPPSATTPPPAPESAIVEAQGLVTQPDGSLYLTANTTPTQPPVLLTSHCHVR